MTREGNLVSAAWLAAHLDAPDVVVFDCRFDLTRPTAGREQYAQGHIPGAHYLDLEEDLSAPKQPHGGRHPLPELSTFCGKMGALGIDEAVTVVAYDAQHGAMAARLWWMLRFLGHDRVRVLDGGWGAWVAGGFPVSRDVRAGRPRTFVPRLHSGILVDIEDLRRRRSDRTRLVDSRAPERYRGEVEPLDPVAGHIPGAANLPWDGNVDEQGFLKPVEALRERFAGLRDDPGDVVVYCGSGVTACVVLHRASLRGREGKLYPGGWSEWSQRGLVMLEPIA